MPRLSSQAAVAGLGGALGIGFVWWLTVWLWGEAVALPIVPSMGAGAVLLFAAPRSPLAGSWPALGGHLISACVGVAVAKALGTGALAAALAVGLAVAAMTLARCLHPPGGATALVAVIGGEAVHQLGFSFVLAPVMLNAALLWLFARFWHWALARFEQD